MRSRVPSTTMPSDRAADRKPGALKFVGPGARTRGDEYRPRHLTPEEQREQDIERQRVLKGLLRRCLRDAGMPVPRGTTLDGFPAWWDDVKATPQARVAVRNWMELADALGLEIPR